MPCDECSDIAEMHDDLELRFDDLHNAVRNLLAAHDAYVNHKATNPNWVKEEALREEWNRALDAVRKFARRR